MSTAELPLGIGAAIARIVGAILLATLLTCMTTSLVVVVCDACGWESPRQTRLFTRLGQLFLLTVFLIPAKRAGVLGGHSVGLRPTRGWKRGMAVGFLVGLLSIGLLFCLYITLGWAKVYGDASYALHAKRVWSYIVSAFLVAFLEEWFFHGVLLALFSKWRSPLFALFAVNMVFSPLHGIRGERSFAGLEPSWTTGFELFPHLGAGYLEANALATTFGILLFGIALTLIRNWTKTIYLSVGLHAAWIYGKRLDGHFTYWDTDRAALWTGGEHYLAGLPGWGLLALTTAGIYWTVKGRRAPEAFA